MRSEFVATRHFFTVDVEEYFQVAALAPWAPTDGVGALREPHRVSGGSLAGASRSITTRTERSSPWGAWPNATRR